jgi:hypothetical protein
MPYIKTICHQSSIVTVPSGSANRESLEAELMRTVQTKRFDYALVLKSLEVVQVTIRDCGCEAVYNGIPKLHNTAWIYIRV